MKELISLVVNNKKVEEGARMCTGGTFWDMNAFEWVDSALNKHSDFFSKPH
jgi:hypothetical protein